MLKDGNNVGKMGCKVTGRRCEAQECFPGAWFGSRAIDCWELAADIIAFRARHFSYPRRKISML